MNPVVTLLFALLASAYAAVPRLNGRIVGGEEVDIRQFPYQVSVRYDNVHNCGGSIINEYTILTAAHCVYGVPDEMFSVSVGSNVFYLGDVYVVDRVIPHDYYDPYTADNDVAILKLKNPLTYSDTVQPIELQEENLEVPENTKAWVSGWGRTVEGSKVVSTKLLATDLDVISNNDCQKRYYPLLITEQMMCAQTIGHDSCQGDSGGPLVANGKLIGVVSWGMGCARPEFPGVYSKVSILYSWIKENSL